MTLDEVNVRNYNPDIKKPHTSKFAVDCRTVSGLKTSVGQALNQTQQEVAHEDVDLR